MFTFLIFFFTIIATALLSVFSGLIAHWYDFYWIIVFFIGGFFAFTLLSIVFLFVTSLFFKKSDEVPNEKYNKFARFILEEYLKFMCFFCRIKLVVSGRELLPEGRFLLVSNHLSNFDPIATNAALGRKKEIAWVAKQSLIRVPIAGAFMYQSNFLPMNRSDVRQSLKVINKAAEYIKQDVCSVGIYPEGTRNTTKETLLPFKPGALKIAQKAGCPLVVMTIVNTELVRKRFPFLRTRVYIDLLKVYSAKEVEEKNTNELTAEIEQSMRENILIARERRV